MAAFDPVAALAHPLDYRLAVRGPVTLFHDRGVLDEAVTWLRGHGYRVARADAGRWTSAGDMHDGLASALDFPAYYGRNLDALEDCLRDVAAGDYGWEPGDTGLALVLGGFDRYAEREPRVAHALLDIFTTRSRAATLVGHRLLCLAQTDDPGLALPEVGATPVRWNDAEAAGRRPGR